MANDAAPDTRRMMRVKGHPGVFRRGERYVVVYRYRGKQRKKAFRTLTEAKRFKGKADAGEARPSAAITFKAYTEEWIKSYHGRTAKGLTEDTRASYADALTRFAIPYFGTTRLEHIDAPRVRAWIARLAEQGLAPETVRRYHAPVRALLATAYEDGLLPTNPAQGVRVIVSDRRPARPPKHLTAEQTARLLAEIPPEQADLVYLLATAGGRITETLNAVYAGLGHDAGQPVLRFPKSKTEAGLQPIPLTPEAARMLTRRRAAADAGPEALIFPNAAGHPYDRRGWTRRVFKPAAERAGVPWASPHKLRHGVATLMAERGYEAHDIARVLRHADGGALAQRTYMHPKARAVDFLDDALRGNTGATDGATARLNPPASD